VRHLVAAGVLLVAAGCHRSDELIPYFGKWDGGFDVRRPARPHAGERAFTSQEQRLGGFLMLYGSRMKFFMQLEGPQQVIEIEGRWEKTGRDVRLIPATFRFDDFGGEDVRDPNRPYVLPEQVRSALGKPIRLRFSSDEKRLDGLLIEIGGMTGELRFRRG